MSAAVKRLISPTKSGTKSKAKGAAKRGWSLRTSRSPAKEAAEAPASVAQSESGEENALDMMNGLDSSLMEFEPVKQLNAAFESAVGPPSTALQVLCRLRPLAEGEERAITPKLAENQITPTVVRAEPPVAIRHKKEWAEARDYSFTKVLEESSSQDEVYSCSVKPLVSAFLEKGKSGLVFTFGVTNAGKSYTMLGNSSSPGLIPRTVAELCERSEESDKDLTLSYHEIYNEQIFDLLSNRQKKLDIRDRAGRPEVLNLSRHTISCADDAMKLLAMGAKNRHNASTNLNKDSSRSHCVCALELGKATLWLVDLAGSERGDRTGNTATGKKQGEANNINTSLFTLMTCLANLRSGKNKINQTRFRESKLTRLLSSHLSGKRGSGGTVMIVNASPSAADFTETCHVMNQCSRCTKIKVVEDDKPCRQEAMLATANLTDANGRRVRPGGAGSKRAAEKNSDELARDSGSSGGGSRRRLDSQSSSSSSSSQATTAFTEVLVAENDGLREQVEDLKSKLETVEMEIREECSQMLAQFMPGGGDMGLGMGMGMGVSTSSDLSAEPAPSLSEVPAVLKSARKKKHQDDVVKVIEDLKGKCDDLEDELATSHDDNRVLRKRLDALTAAQLHGAAGGVDESAEAPPEKWMILDFLMQLCQSPGDLDDDELQQREAALTKALQFSALSPLRNVARKFGLNGSSDDEASTSASTVDGSMANGEALAGAVRDALFPEEDRQLLRDVCESEALAQLSMVHEELHGAKQAAEKWQLESERLQTRVSELEAQVDSERQAKEEAETMLADMAEREETARAAAEAEAAAIQAAAEAGFPPADEMDEAAEEDLSAGAGGGGEEVRDEEGEEEEGTEEEEEGEDDRVETSHEAEEEKAADDGEAASEGERESDFVDDMVGAPAAVDDIEGLEKAAEAAEEPEAPMPPLPPPAAAKKAPKSPLVSMNVNSPSRARDVPKAKTNDSKKFSPCTLSRTNDKIRQQAEASKRKRTGGAKKTEKKTRATPVARRTRSSKVV